MFNRLHINEVVISTEVTPIHIRGTSFMHYVVVDVNIGLSLLRRLKPIHATGNVNAHTFAANVLLHATKRTKFDNVR